MKMLGIMFLLSLSFNAQAVTQAYFSASGQVMVNMQTGSFAGSDPDPENLYNKMNVVPESSIVGLGKVIEDKDKSMHLICTDRGNSQFFCTLVLKPSAKAQINFANKTFKYQAIGEEAKELFNQFHSQEGSFSYTNSDGAFAINANQDEFVVEYR